MKWAELRRLAEDAGWKLVRHGSKHDIFVHSGRKDVLMMERHYGQEVRKGLLNKILKQI